MLRVCASRCKPFVARKLRYSILGQKIYRDIYSQLCNDQDKDSTILTDGFAGLFHDIGYEPYSHEVLFQHMTRLQQLKRRLNPSHIGCIKFLIACNDLLNQARIENEICYPTKYAETGYIKIFHSRYKLCKSFYGNIIGTEIEKIICDIFELFKSLKYSYRIHQSWALDQSGSHRIHHKYLKTSKLKKKVNPSSFDLMKQKIYILRLRLSYYRRMLTGREIGQHEQAADEGQRKIIKFKVLKTQLLPYIHSNHSNLEVNLSQFTKKSFDNKWKSQAYVRQKYALSKLYENQQNTNKLERIKSQLKNEKFYLKMQRNDLNKRLESHLLIRAAMKEVANNQQYQLGRSGNAF